jgi:hypothetical protein
MPRLAEIVVGSQKPLSPADRPGRLTAHQVHTLGGCLEFSRVGAKSFETRALIFRASDQSPLIFVVTEWVEFIASSFSRRVA